ncbi:TadE/TadG family type IV pilus assembly protein [Aliivibrio kagoshimensis]|jgi:Flp pilus assembly protein TadG|uniref:TadE/TadG family type IV pilus assembly protein n=1 Tax=Aliivibrio kagoshimensis TaxID=2910230 RepID=UPI003D0C68B0
MTSHKHHQSGLAAVELAITLPILLLLLVGVSELGRAMIQYNTLNKAVQNGARYAITDIYGTNSATQLADSTNIKNIVIYGNKGGTGTKVLHNLTASDVSINQSGNYVTITASYNFTPHFAKLPSFFGYGGDSLSFGFSASTAMRTSP